MIGVEDLIVKINTLIGSGSLTEDQVVQLSGAVNALENYGVSKVLTAGNLPNPVTNKGRFIFIESENRYVFSDGVTWDINSLIDVSGIRLYAWGNGTIGRLGDNTIVGKSSPVSVVGGFTDWIQVSAASLHNLGLRANGTAWAWGAGSGGRLGDNTTVSKSSPVSVVGGFTDWIQLSAGGTHSLGLRADGTAWAWGTNTNGQLGDNTVVSKTSPVSVVGGGVLWTQLSAGSYHNLGLRADGTAWAWGNNTSGRLGDNTSVSKSSPVSVVGGFVDWIQLSAGNLHSLGLRANGTAWAWGDNQNGRLGIGNTSNFTSPVSVIGGFTDWTQLSTGGYGGSNGHSIGLRANGTLWAWGLNTTLQLGDGTATSRLSPVSVIGGFTDWVRISGGSTHNIGIRSNGSVWTWGGNLFGQLGNNAFGLYTSSASPISIVGGFTDWVEVSAGNSHSIAIRG